MKEHHIRLNKTLDKLIDHFEKNKTFQNEAELNKVIKYFKGIKPKYYLRGMYIRNNFDPRLCNDINRGIYDELKKHGVKL